MDDHDMLFNSEVLSDFKITVKDEVFAVHKYILYTKNTVFAAMIENEPPDDPLHHIFISDFEPEDFSIFLQYLYTSKLEPHYVSHDLLRIADRYLDDNLKKLCGDALRKHLRTSNMIELFLLALETKCDNLRRYSSDMIVINFPAVKDSPEFKAILHYPVGSTHIVEAFHSKMAKMISGIPSGIKRTCSFDFNIVIPDNVFRHSSEFYVDSIKWSMMIGNKDGFFSLYCINPMQECDNFCEAECEFTLVSQMKGKTSKSRKFVHTFKKDISENNCGYPTFLPWSTLNNPKYGFIKDNIIIVYITLEVLRKGEVKDLVSIPPRPLTPVYFTGL